MTPDGEHTVGMPAVHGTGSVETEEPFPGVRRETHQTRHATVTAYAFAPGAAFPPHRHPEEQITVVLEGSVQFTVGGDVRRLASGETYAVPGDVEHSLRAGPSGAQFLAVVVPRRARPDAYEIQGDPR